MSGWSAGHKIVLYAQWHAASASLSGTCPMLVYSAHPRSRHIRLDAMARPRPAAADRLLYRGTAEFLQFFTLRLAIRTLACLSELVRLPSPQPYQSPLLPSHPLALRSAVHPFPPWRDQSQHCCLVYSLWPAAPQHAVCTNKVVATSLATRTGAPQPRQPRQQQVAPQQRAQPLAALLQQQLQRPQVCSSNTTLVYL